MPPFYRTGTQAGKGTLSASPPQNGVIHTLPKRRFGILGILHLYILIWREVERLTSGGRAVDFLVSAGRHLAVCSVDNPSFSHGNEWCKRWSFPVPGVEW